MKLIIETAVNGYVLREEPMDEMGRERLTVVASEDPTVATRDMLVEVLELIGHLGSRYDEWRVRVILEHGDKWTSSEDWALEHTGG